MFLKSKVGIAETEKIKVKQRPHPYHIIEGEIKHKAAVAIMGIVPSGKAQHPVSYFKSIQQQ